MEDPQLLSGPETAWYRERLYKERRNLRLLGAAILGFGLLLLLAALLLASGHNWGNFALFLLLALLPLFQGLRLLRASAKQVTPEAIVYLRQQERAQLFRQAQGQRLPWRYSLWARLLEAALGLFFLLEGGQALFDALSTGFQSSEASLFVWITLLAFLLLGLFCLADSFYLKPRKAQLFSERSSAELAYRLELGEHGQEQEPPE